MSNKLEQLRQMTLVVADTGDIQAIQRYRAQDATTNPSLLLKAAQLPEYAGYITDAAAWAARQGGTAGEQLIDAVDRFADAIGAEILKIVPGRVSTEVDARLSFDTDAMIARARKLI